MQKRLSVAGAVLCVLVLALGVGAQTKSNPGFETLKSLVGEWQGTNPEGKLTRVSYRLVSNGTALMETINSSDDMEMITVYHPDGARLAMTHFCAANNQPRMMTGPVTAGAKQFKFTFVGITNLASPDAGHMRGLVLSIEDKDHMSQTWTWRDKGQDKDELFKLTRKP